MISPLLANVALHGMEKALGIKRDRQGLLRGHRAVVRYADDFVVFCETREDAVQCIRVLRDWLAERGLQFSQEKTQIVHLEDGFDFLGFNVRQYKDPRYKSGGKRRIQPSRKSVSRIKEKLREIWHQGLCQPTELLLIRLNQIVRGWAYYFRTQASTRTFVDLDSWMFQRAVRLAKRRHGGKSWKWLRLHYWGCLHPTRRDRWVFGVPTKGLYLQKFSWVRFQRHTLVQGYASPDDPTLSGYWEKRRVRKRFSRVLTDRTSRAFFSDSHSGKRGCMWSA